MKVTDIKTFAVDCFRTNWVFVKVYTDEGIDGVGEATLEYKEKALFGAVARAASISVNAVSPTEDVGVLFNIIAFWPTYNCSPSGKFLVVEQAINKSMLMHRDAIY